MNGGPVKAHTVGLVQMHPLDSTFCTKFVKMLKISCIYHAYIVE